MRGFFGLCHDSPSVQDTFGSGTLAAKRRRLEYILTITSCRFITMHRYCLCSSLSLLGFVAGLSGAQTQSPPLTYPTAARGSQVDVYHGVSIADPYRWLEDTDAPATKAWVEAENKLSDSFLATIPERAAIKSRLTQLWNYARFGSPFKEGGRYFYFE